MPTYTEEEPREIRFDELDLYFPEVLELYFPEVLECSFGEGWERRSRNRDLNETAEEE